MIQAVPNSSSQPRLRLHLFFFFLGGFALLTQTLVLKETLVVAMGNELSFGVVFAVWLGGIFTGGLAGSRMADRTRRPLSWTIRLTTAFVTFSLSAILLIRIFHHFSGHSGPGRYIPFFQLLITSFLLIVPIGVTIGILFPMGSRMVLNTDVRHLTGIYLFEATGSMVVGVIYTFFMAQSLNPFQILSIFSLPLFLVLLSMKSKKGKGRIHWLIIPLILNLGLFLPPVNRSLENWSRNLQWEAISNSQLVSHTQSRYHDIAIGRREGGYQMYLSGKLSRTFPEPYTSMLTASLLYTQHRDLRKILIIGDPAFELADELNRFGPVTVHAVELDKKTVALGKKYLDYTPLANHRIFVTDYRLFAERIRDRNYQMIYIKTPNPSTLLNNRSYTLDFLRVLKGLLTEDGILALDLHRVANYYQGLRGRYTAVIFQTLNSAFNRSIITSGYRRMVFASDSNRHLSSEGTEVEDRFARSRHPDQALKYLLGDFYDPEEMASIEFQLTDQSIPALNTRRRPISVFLFHQIEGWYSALNLENLGTLFASLKIEYLALPMLLLLLGLVLLRTRTTIAGPDPFRWNRRALYLAVFITGFSSLSLHLLLIYRFQNSIGYTYLMIGFLSALFMAGLPLGTLLSRRYLKRSSKPPPVFLIILSQFFMILIALVVNHSSRQPPHFLWDLSLILLLILALGIATGALYPPFARLLLEAGISGGRIAGFFYAFDHLGAALGALSLSTFLLVYYGFGWSCTLLSLLLFFSVLVLLITHILPRRPQKNRR